MGQHEQGFESSQISWSVCNSFMILALKFQWTEKESAVDFLYNVIGTSFEMIHKQENFATLQSWVVKRS